jgi:hypothetical protein
VEISLLAAGEFFRASAVPDLEAVLEAQKKSALPVKTLSETYYKKLKIQGLFHYSVVVNRSWLSPCKFNLTVSIK